MPGLSLSRLSMDVTRGPLPVERMCVLDPGGKMWKSQFGLQVKRVLLLPSPVVPSAPFCFLHLHTWEQNITVATPPSATNMKFQSCNLEADWNTDRREKKLKCELFYSILLSNSCVMRGWRTSPQLQIGETTQTACNWLNIISIT